MSKYVSQAPDCVFYICCGSKCKKKGGKKIFKNLKAHLKTVHRKKLVQVMKTSCTDRCKMGPVVAVMPHNVWYLEVSEDTAMQIFDKHIELKT